MLGPPKLRLLDQPVLVSLEGLVPPDNFYRFLDQRLDLSFVRTMVQELYAEHGRPSIDPVVFFKLQLILFFEGLRSERKLMETVQLNLAHRWYLGYRLDQPLPHHSSLTRIRARLGLPIFERFFALVVELCQQAGLVWGKELLFDATKVRANAAVDSLVPRWYAAARAHLDDLFTGEEGGTASAPPEADSDPLLMEGVRAVSGDTITDGTTPSRLPFAGTSEQDQRLTTENRAVWRLLDEYRLDPQRPPSSSYQRTTDSKVSTTDPDAAPMRAHLGDRTKLGYHDHYVVDGGRARIILAAFVTPADVMENTPMLDLLRRVRFRYRLRPQQVVGDTTYGTMENIRALEDEGIRAYVPLADFEARSSFYGTSRFTYDAVQDVYRCPQDQVLTRLAVKVSVEKIEYRASATVCNACPVKAACTESDHGRLVSRPFATPYLDRVRGYHTTEAYAKAMRKRQVWVEPLFGEAKQWHGLRQFRLRGLWQVNCEGLRIAAGQNLKRWLTKMGWGRRHGPAGNLALAAIPHRRTFSFRLEIFRLYEHHRFSTGWLISTRYYRTYWTAPVPLGLVVYKVTICAIHSTQHHWRYMGWGVATNAAWARFFRTLGAAANRLAADLAQASATPEPLGLAGGDAPAALVIGERQKAVVALPGLRGDGGMKTAEIARAIGPSDIPNVYQAMRTLEKRGMVELVPNRAPQRWRFATRYRELPEE